MRNWLIGVVVVAAAVGVAYWLPGTAETQEGEGYTAPRNADGQPDLSGFWQAINTAEYDILAHSPEWQVPAGLGIVEEHVMTRHAQTVHGRERRLPGQTGPRLGAERDRIERGNGKLQRRRAAADDVGDIGEHGAEAHVLPAQDIALAYSAAVQG